MTPAERDEVRRIASGFFACEPKDALTIHLLATVAQRAGLTKEYAMGRISEMVPRAMDASEADEHIDIHAGGVSS